MIGTTRAGQLGRRSQHGRRAMVIAGMLVASLIAAATGTSVAAGPSGGHWEAPLVQPDPLGLELVGGAPAVADQVLVRFGPGATAAQRSDVQALAGAVRVRPVGGPGFGLYRLDAPGKDVAALMRTLSGHPAVRYAEPNYLVQSMVSPNDTRFGELWGLNNTGQTDANGQVGTPGVDIDAAQAWDVTTGSASNVVGVVDTGIDYNHADLAANVWSAPSAFTVTIAGKSITCAAGTHGFRSEGVGGVMSCDPMDDNNVTSCVGSTCTYGRHGTHVSGTIGAKGNNGQGVAGVNWTAGIMGLKFLNFTGSGYIEDAINVIEFAIQAKQQGKANIRMLNNSWGGAGFSQALLDQINKAGANDILFVAAAGNSNANNDTTPTMPGGMKAASLISVAATDNKDAKASFSSYGPATVHLGAPGVSILSTVGRAGVDYHPYSGTSMATPHVTGASALVLAACPGLDTAGLKSALLNTVDPVSSMSGITVTGGRLNVNNAVQSCVGPYYVSASPTFRSVSPAKSTTYTVTVGVNDGFAGAVSLSASGLPSGAAASFSPSTITGGGTSTMTVTAGTSTPLGTYTLTIKGTSGAITSSTKVTLEVATADFTISAAPASRLVNPGAVAAYTVSLGVKGSFTSAVSLSASGLPSGTTASFSPSSLTPPGTSTLSVSTSASTPEGVHTLTVKGVGGGLTRTTTVSLEVRKPSFSYTLSPLTRTIKKGWAVSTLMSVTGQYGFNGTVSFSVTGVCPGCTVSIPGPATVTPSQPYSGAKSSVLHTSSANTPAGVYTMIWTASGGGVSKTITVTLTVTN